MDIIIYHDNCPDGITALWIAKKKWPTAEPYPGNYDVPPDLHKLAGKDVLICDFSWKRSEMLALAGVCKSLLLIDHHKSAEAELKGLPFCIFDMDRSGAGLTWDTLFPRVPRPPLVNYVEDCDLWRFKLPHSRQIAAACASYSLTLAMRDELMGVNIMELAECGRHIMRYQSQLVRETVKHALRETIAGFDVPSIALPTRALISSVANELARTAPFAAAHVTNIDGSRSFSLRSTGDECVDVSEIAALFGGGGHRNAAGFLLRPGQSLNP